MWTSHNCRVMAPDPDGDLEAQHLQGCVQEGKPGRSLDPTVPMPAFSSSLIQLPKLLQTLLD